VSAGAVVSSPLVRAKQTADPLAERFAERRVTETPYLGIDTFKKRKLTAFAAAQNQETVILVGHQPTLGEYAAWLLGAERAAVPFEKAGAALIRFDGSPGKGDGELVWLVTPEWFL
jgi:phosphohistidine phosphatase